MVVSGDKHGRSAAIDIGGMGATKEWAAKSRAHVSVTINVLLIHAHMRTSSTKSA